MSGSWGGGGDSNHHCQAWKGTQLTFLSSISFLMGPTDAGVSVGGSNGNFAERWLHLKWVMLTERSVWLHCLHSIMNHNSFFLAGHHNLGSRGRGQAGVLICMGSLSLPPSPNYLSDALGGVWWAGGISSCDSPP
jgi:hypothetical protein